MPVPQTSQRPSRVLLSDLAYDAIRELILNGELAPGEKIDDTDLQRWLDSSRTPIREALNRLQVDGLIETVAQRHTRVVSPDPADVPDIVRSLGAVMSGATRLTIPTLNKRDRDLLIRIAQAAKAGAQEKDHQAHLNAVLSFHELVMELCPNPFYTESARGALTRLGFYLRVANTENIAPWDQLVHGHDSLIAALTESDAVRAELAVSLIHMI